MLPSVFAPPLTTCRCPSLLAIMSLITRSDAQVLSWKHEAEPSQVSDMFLTYWLNAEQAGGGSVAYRR